MSPVSVGPHDFEPLRWWDRLRQHGRCRGCYASRSQHPVREWTAARPLGDRSRVRQTAAKQP